MDTSPQACIDRALAIMRQRVNAAFDVMQQQDFDAGSLKARETVAHCAGMLDYIAARQKEVQP